VAVSVQGNFTNYGDTEIISGFVVVSLVGPSEYSGMFYDNLSKAHFQRDHIWRAEIECDGSWTVGPLPTNDIISPQTAQGETLTFYKVNFIINSQHVAVDSFVLTKEMNKKSCISLEEVSFNAISCNSSDYICSFVQKCETVFSPDPGCGIEILQSDCLELNGHDPKISLRLSEDNENQLSFGSDCGLYFSWDCNFLDSCNLRDLGDVCNHPNQGDILRFDGCEWECAPAFSCDELDACDLSDLGDVADVYGTQCSFLVKQDKKWTPLHPFDDSTCITVDDQCNIDLVIAEDECNLLICQEDGLMVTPPIVLGSFAKCIETFVTGRGCDNDPYVVSAKPIISNDECNIIECVEDGILVAPTHMFAIQAPDLHCEADNGDDGFVPGQFFHYAGNGDERIDKVVVSVCRAPYGSDMLLHVFDGTTQKVLDEINIAAGSLVAESSKGFILAANHFVGIRVESGPLDEECVASFLNAQFYYCFVN